MFEEQIKRHKLASNGDISSALEKPIYSPSQQIKALSSRPTHLLGQRGPPLFLCCKVNGGMQMRLQC